MKDGVNIVEEFVVESRALDSFCDEGEVVVVGMEGCSDVEPCSVWV